MHDFCLTIPYGMLVAAGGLIGFALKGSTASLIAGCGSGGLLLLLGYGGYKEYLSKDGKVSKTWTFASLSVSGALVVAMGGRWQRTGKLMPAGMVALISVAMSAFYLAKLAGAFPSGGSKKKP